MGGPLWSAIAALLAALVLGLAPTGCKDDPKVAGNTDTTIAGDTSRDAGGGADTPEPADLPVDAPESADLPVDAPEPGDLPVDTPEPGDLPVDAPELVDVPADAPEPTDLPVDAPDPPDTAPDALGDAGTEDSSVEDGGEPTSLCASWAAVQMGFVTSRCEGLATCCGWETCPSEPPAAFESILLGVCEDAIAAETVWDAAQEAACLAASTVDCGAPFNVGASVSCSSGGSGLECEEPPSKAAVVPCRRIIRGPLAEGAACTWDGQCSGDAVCVPESLVSASGTCVVPVAGGSCGKHADCPADLLCVGGSCVPLPGDGDACDGDLLTCFGGGCRTGSCADGLQCLANTCTSFAAVSEACDGGTLCDPTTAWCDGATCAAKKTNGLTCSSHEECVGRCSASSCADLAGEDEVCDDDFDCAGLCDQDTKTCHFTSPTPAVAACGPYHP